MILLLQWRKYSDNAETPIKVVAAAASLRPMHLKI